MRRYAGWMLAAFVALTPAQAQVYKWVDANGRTQYGEKPPEGVRATEVKTQGNAPTAPPESAETWKQKELEFQRRRVEREKRERQEEAANSKSSPAARRECNSARRDLEVLEAEIPVYTRNDKGERVYIPDSDRPAKLKEARQRVRDACPS